MAKSLKSVTVGRTEHLLPHVGQSRVNQYEIRTRNSSGDYDRTRDHDAARR
ncbi:hypothetical protein BPNPMPFG_006309 [Mesorhizobium sp. AR07]|uniref:hypothetical protein n=1 Tax=Mesorhizobium sp. AR07 TaxID=2865838 RepID=UPI00215E007A|nr:hypothetical protein [Mesorhizobium sp. AR07]UVK44394.1 hypothetical protein BPNPMPFG_006309 [Mesorhizobium sp. AR07]